MASVCLGSRRILIYGQRPQAEALPRCPLGEPLLGDPQYKWGRRLSSLVPHRGLEDGCWLSSPATAARPGTSSGSEYALRSWCLQHFRLGAKWLLPSRKIFVQGLGTRRRGNKSHLAVEQAALLRVALSAARLPQQALGLAVWPRNPTPKQTCFGDEPRVPAVGSLSSGI